MSEYLICSESNTAKNRLESQFSRRLWIVVTVFAALLCGSGCGPSAVEATAASPATPPPGSYQLSCSNISLGSNDVLTASCQKLDGSTQQSSLTGVEGCLASIVNRGDIGNVDGNLMCIPDLPVTGSGIHFPEAETVINQWIYQGLSRSSLMPGASGRG